MNVLVLASHTDDEINCSGTIAKHILNRDLVRVLAFSKGNDETGATVSEYINSMKALRVYDYHLFDFETRYFYKDRQKILQLLCDEKKPDVVYCPCSWDIHQDHQVISQEAVRAFKSCSIYGYEIWHNEVLETNFTHYVSIKKEQFEIKKKLIDCYQSQKDRPYMNYSLIESLGRLRGMQISMQYAEAFQTIRDIEK